MKPGGRMTDRHSIIPQVSRANSGPINRELTSAAFHIAGQVVVAHCLGYEVTSASVLEQQAREQQAERPPRASCTVNGALEPGDLTVFHVAGSVTSLIQQGRYALGNPTAGASTREPRLRARTLVEDHWGLVDSVASALLRRGTLDRDALAALFDDSPPMVHLKAL
jgi:hypothetical protein